MSEIISKITKKPMGEIGLLDIVEVTRKGFPPATLVELAQTLEFDKVSEMDSILNVSKRSLQRYVARSDDEPLSAKLSDHILQIAKVYERTLDVFGDREKALRWLKSPITALMHEKPLSLLDTSAGVDMVLDELGRIEHGIFD